jgi:hypothetical protein
MLWMREDGKKFPVWLEIDNATEYFKRFSQLLNARIECLTSGAYTQAFPEAEGAVVIAYVVAGRTAEAAKARVKQLRRWTIQILTEGEMAHWAGIFRYTDVLLSEVYARGLYEKPIWLPPSLDADTPVSLLNP